MARRMAAHDTILPLHFKNLKLISGLMKDLILKSFGPKCQKTLIISSTGQNFATKDGITILSSVHFSHPVAKCILESVNSFCEVYGDGCKTFLIYLHHLFEAVEDELLKHSDFYRDDVTYRSATAKSLGEFISQDFVYLSEQLKSLVHNQNKTLMVDEESNQKYYYMCLFQSYFCGSLPPEDVHHLSELLATYVDSMHCEKHCLIVTLQWFDKLVLSVNESYSHSHCTEGIFLRGALSLKFPNNSISNAVLMQCPFEADKDSKSAGDTISPVQLSEKIITHKFEVVMQFLSKLKSHGVSLILTPHKVPGYILQMADELNINVVSCLEESDMEFLMCATGKIMVTSIWDDIDSVCLFAAKSYESVYLTGNQYLKLLLESSAENFPYSSLFLCAPTNGLVTHLMYTAKKSFKVVSQCLSVCSCEDQKLQLSVFMAKEEVNISISSLLQLNPDVQSCKNISNMTQYTKTSFSCEIIGGGGYFEYLLSHLISKYLTENTKLAADVKFCCRLLVKMLSAVPQTLYQNLSSSQSIRDSTSYLSAFLSIRSALEESSVVGFYSSNLLVDPSQYGLWEVLDVKVATVMEVLLLAERLLRVDTMVGVTKLSGAVLNQPLKKVDGDAE
ncbi:hypothetical protein Btru_036656 [Bulinus truncatus]|nr:hypothetical protein Btru_036656 [Bulinus truncatus]